MSERKRYGQEDVHRMVSAHFLDLLGAGVIPWFTRWKEMPKSITGWPFEHVNVWLLADLSYPDSIYLTWKQIRKLNASVKFGEQGHPIVGIRHTSIKPALYCSEVFNIDQLDYVRDEHLPPKEEVKDALVLCREIVARMPKFPTVVETNTSIHYNLSTDTVYLPPIGFCKTEGQCYSAVFYTLAQSTGHPKRLRRKTCVEQKFIDAKRYSCEQLCIEMACSYLCGFAGIEPWYLSQYHFDPEEWVKAIQEDNTLPIFAGLYAQEIINFILNLPPFTNPLRLLP